MVPLILLNDGHKIPQLGFGLWQVGDSEATTAVAEAFRTGYRSIDSASIYGNEAGLGRAIASSELPRESLFITTKLWNSDQGYDETLRAFDQSMKKLGLAALDLYLIHWPAPKKDRYVATWKALVRLKEEGRVKSIGVSNFGRPELERVIDATGVTPAVNQIELHPHFQQLALRSFHSQHNIATESWSPLGQAKFLNDATIGAIATRLGKSAAQVILRWHIQSDLIVIPKSVTPSRIHENFALFDFSLTTADMSAIASLDRTSGRIGPDPSTATF